MGQPPVDLNMRSVFLGIFENDNPLVQFGDESLIVAPGDRLILYTDGLTEAPGREGGMYGLDRLRTLMASHRSEDVHSLRETIWEDLNAFTQGEFPDDVAFIIVDF
jgi:serine phosphatase RsbU (regulator of sigma subunit)